MSKRRYLPTLSELIDRLSIAQLKEVFITEHKGEYAQEIKDIVHDIQLILGNSEGIDAETIRAIVVPVFKTFKDGLTVMINTTISDTLMFLLSVRTPIT